MAKKKRANKYEEKLIVKGSFSDLLKATKKDAQINIKKKREAKKK